VIHGRPRDKLFGKHIHPAKKSQFDEKLQKSRSRKTKEPDSLILSRMRSRWAGISVQCKPDRW